MPKLHDIASYANVSVSTVSKVLNGSHEISRATANRVIRAAQELNYVFDSYNAKILNSAQKTIGVIAPEAISSYYSVLVHSIQSILSQNGFQTLAAFSNFSPLDEIKLLRMFAKKGIDGVIMIRAGSEYTTTELEKFKKESYLAVIQIVLQIEDNNISAGYDGYIVDEEYGIYCALKFLNELGHERIVFIGEPMTKLRVEFFLKSMKKLGLSAGEGNIFLGSERFELGGYLRMKDVLQNREQPTAVFAAYDNMAIGAMRAIQEAGLEVPGDVSVIGFDDIPISRYLRTPLSTIGVPFAKLAQLSVESLKERLKTGDSSGAVHGTIKPDFYVRESTEKVKKHKL